MSNMVQAIKPKREPISTIDIVMGIFRLLLIIVFISAFLSGINPVHLSGIISRHASLFTCAINYSTIGNVFIRALNNNWVDQSALSLSYSGAIIMMIAILGITAAFCLSFGNLKMRRLGILVTVVSALVGYTGTAFLQFVAYPAFLNSSNPERLDLRLPTGIFVFYILWIIVALFSIYLILSLPKPENDEVCEMDAKYKLFLMILPFLVLVALFSYLPLWGWRISFFDFRSGFQLTMDEWVGLKWVRFLFTSPAIRVDIARVMTNTLALSAIGLSFSWLPLVFAIFLAELKSTRTKRLIQTFTTIPNFISWVLVYSVAFALFSTEGFINWMLIGLGIIEEGTNMLMNGNNVWMRMWLWGTWKGLGWGAIIYIAAISSIDQQLYEAATVDGAGRFRKMWHITVPGLMPTFFVLLLIGISNILNNGMEQYLVFQNANTRASLEVLDLYIYNLGLSEGGGATMPLATLIGMLKSVISVVLLFGANALSKVVRGESIV